MEFPNDFSKSAQLQIDGFYTKNAFLTILRNINRNLNKVSFFVAVKPTFYGVPECLNLKNGQFESSNFEKNS